MLRSAIFVYLLLLLLPPTLRSQTTAAPEKSEFSYLVRPSFTFFMSTAQRKDDESLLLSMYGQLRSQMSFDLFSIHVKSYLNADFKREAYSDAAPKNLRDDLIVSFIPSVVVSQRYNVSLFLELTMETDMANGERDGIKTSFMDPAFFTKRCISGNGWTGNPTTNRSA